MGWIESGNEKNVRILSFNRPDVRNAVSSALLEELLSEVARAREDRARCLVLEGRGVDFGSGGDLTQTTGFDEWFEVCEQAVAAIYRFPAPTIAVIQGNVMGASLELALACDLRFVAEDARIQVGFDKWGAPLEIISGAVLPRLMGASRAKLFYFGRQVLSGIDAVREKLADRAISREALREEAITFAEEVAAGPTFAFARTKDLIDKSFHRTLDEHLAAARDVRAVTNASEDVAEADRAFREGRAPVFKGC